MLSTSSRGRPAALGGDEPQVVVHLQHAALRLAQLLEVAVAEDREDVARPRLQLLAVADRHPEQFGDHVRGQRVRQVAYHVHLALRGNGVEELAGELAHPWP